MQARAPTQEPPVLMCDGLESRNVPKDPPVVVANCLVHARRGIVEQFANFPAQCTHVLEQLSLVFKTDTQCKQQGLDDQARLLAHQRDSAPVLQALHQWLLTAMSTKQVEPNSGLGKAYNYILKRWDKLTLFLRRPGAPLDNNICERALKMAIAHRRNSLFYKTQHGAAVGDLFMSLIYTAELHHENPFAYLTELQRHAKAVAADPDQWLPWTYRATLARLAALQPAARARHRAPTRRPPQPSPHRPLPRSRPERARSPCPAEPARWARSATPPLSHTRAPQVCRTPSTSDHPRGQRSPHIPPISASSLPRSIVASRGLLGHQLAGSCTKHLLADEHHQKRDGLKTYLATTVAQGCLLGVEPCDSADGPALQTAYGVFKQEAQDVEPNYTPKTVNTDGWSGTQAAWKVLFPRVSLVLCFLHAWLSIRDRAKHMGTVFTDLSRRIWEAYHAATRCSFAQRLRRLREFAHSHLTGIVLEKTLSLCNKQARFAQAYRKPGCHRTSNMLDRLMRGMNRYFVDGQHLHGSLGASRLHGRAWALLWNFAPWSPASTRAHHGWRCPAEQLNRHRYHENWLQNLLLSASLGGYRDCRLKPQKA